MGQRKNPRARRRRVFSHWSDEVKSLGCLVREPLGVEELSCGFVDAFVGVCSEEVALCLQEVSGQAFCAVAIVVGERRAEGWHSDAVSDGGADGVAPVCLRFDDDVGEERIQEEVLESGISLVRLFDAVEEVGADDATASPDGCNIAEVELPTVLISCCAELNEPLGVGDDFRGVECVAYGLDEGGAIAGEGGCGWAGQDFCGFDSLGFDGRDDAGFDGGGDGGEGDAHFGGMADGPLAGTFLACLVEDEVDDGFSGFGIGFGEDARGDFDEVAIQLALVPLREDVSEF